VNSDLLLPCYACYGVTATLVDTFTAILHFQQTAKKALKYVIGKMVKWARNTEKKFLIDTGALFFAASVQCGFFGN